MSICSNCGKENEDKNIYCYYCNSEIGPPKVFVQKGETGNRILGLFHSILKIIIVCAVGFLIYYFLLRNDVKVSQLEMTANAEEPNSKIVTCSFYNSGRRTYDFVSLEIDLLDGSGNNIRHHVCTISDLGPQMKKDLREVIFTPAVSAKITKIVKDPPGIQGEVNNQLHIYFDKFKTVLVKIKSFRDYDSKPAPK